jgi:Gluconate 2-dehydrogenase subunit 3
MSKHDEARRAFLKGAAAGAGALAGTGLAPQAMAKPHKTAAADAADAPAQMRMGPQGHGAFFNDEDAATVMAFTERLMPGAPGMPGARDAGVLNYIDLALSGAYADQQDFYRRGLAQLDGFCQQAHQAPFARLDAARQDAVIEALEAGKAAGFSWPTAHGRHVRRPGLRRQQGLRRLAAGGLSGRAAAVHHGRHAEQGRLHPGADPGPAGAGQDSAEEDLSHGDRKD